MLLSVVITVLFVFPGIIDIINFLFLGHSFYFSIKKKARVVFARYSEILDSPFAK